MMYRPSQEFRLWDTWIFPAEDEFHLFHLQNPVGGEWDALGHAVSTDLLHWERQDPIPMKGPQSAWDSGPLLTGMVIQHGDQYAMTFGSVDPDGVQRIGIMFSPDLYHWTKHPGNPVLSACPPYKLRDDWRDAYILRVEDGYEALICARMPDGQACIARMRSDDLVNWNALPPIAIPSVSQCEVPEYFRMGDKHYLIFSCGGRLDDRSRKNTAGTRYLISDNRIGNYVMPQDSLLIGSGNGRFDCYVGRTIEVNGKRMLYYHNCGPRPAEGAPKVIRQNSDGTLWAQYWDGLKGLETDTVLDDVAEYIGDDNWKTEGTRLIGRMDSGVLTCLFPPIISDINFTCIVNIEKGKEAGLLFRYDEETKRGSALILNAQTGNVEIATADGKQKFLRDAMYSGIESGKDYAVRIFARSEFADCYVDDRLLFSTVVDDTPSSGKIGFIVDSGIASFCNLRVASLEPLA